jgi:hypothetical protein
MLLILLSCANLCAILSHIGLVVCKGVSLLYSEDVPYKRIKNWSVNPVAWWVEIGKWHLFALILALIYTVLEVPKTGVSPSCNTAGWIFFSLMQFLRSFEKRDKKRV